MLVMGAAPELQILDARRAAGCERDDVVKFEESVFAASTVWPCESAPTPVPAPDGPFHSSWDMPTGASFGVGCPGPLRQGMFGSLGVTKQKRQGPIDEGGEVAIRHGMPKQRTDALELVVGLLADR